MRTSSDEVRVFHGHVEALLDHRVLVVDVGAGADDRLGASCLVDACAL